VPGYSTEVGEHKAEGAPRNVILISLHGKEKGRTHGGNIYFAEQLAEAGFRSCTPQTPANQIYDRSWGHVSMWENAAEPVAKWLRQFE
jgi:hypothetical protein